MSGDGTDAPDELMLDPRYVAVKVIPSGPGVVGSLIDMKRSLAFSARRRHGEGHRSAARPDWSCWRSAWLRPGAPGGFVGTVSPW